MDNAKNQNQNKQASGRQVNIADNLPGAEYANAAQFQFNKDEMQMLFLNIFGGNGRTAAKIITSPGHFKRIVAVMSQVMDKYEKQHGEVKESQAINSEIGFKA
ncbi:MAG: DUF3467 domain-containing protein [Candidatus Pacebacteria bacterium]|nr:DUF3467 domain-containing protein [Candidatus Paceibacterota bacterium]